MKKLLLILSGALLCFASCYKEKDPLKASDALVGIGKPTIWAIQSHIAGSAEPGVDCRVAQEVLFFKDSTGYFYYPTPCDSTDYDSLSFHWTVSADNKNLYLTNLNGKKSSLVSVIAINYFDETTLRLHGNNYFKRFLDGYFIARPKN